MRAAYAEALTTLRLGRAATAERQLRAIQAAAPGDVNSLRLLGVALLDQDKTSAALETLEQVMLAEPEFADARVDLARAYRRAGQLARARARCGACSRPTRTITARGSHTAMCSSSSKSTRMRSWPSSARD